MSEAKGVANFILEKVPYNKKEEALATLHANDYSTTNIHDILSKIQPIDGSNWTQAEKDHFNNEIFRFRKDLRSVAASMQKDMKCCLAYYFGTFKKSDYYRLLKTVCVEERYEKAASSTHDFDACAICGDGGSLLICDGCEGEYHMDCLRPPLKSIPEGHWECDQCVDRKVLDARAYIIRHSNLYERVDANNKKRKAEDGSEDSHDTEDDNEDSIFRPSSSVLKVMRTLATSISKTISGV